MITTPKPRCSVIGIIAILAAACFIVLCDKATGPSPVQPEVTLLSPKSDTVYYVGDIMTISWKLRDTTSISGLLAEISPDNGKDYYPIGEFLLSYQNILNGVFSWTVQDSMYDYIHVNLESDSCKIWVHDYFNYSLGDTSKGVFSIRQK